MLVTIKKDKLKIKKGKGKSNKDKGNPFVKLKSWRNFNCIFLIFFLFLFTGVIFPQIKIQEKISIKPDSITKQAKHIIFHQGKRPALCLETS